MGYSAFSKQFMLHMGATDVTFSRAKRLRRAITGAEKILWEHIRNRKLLGLKFRRQHPVYCYIGDFYCHEKRLIIEVDGEIPLKKDVVEKDRIRTELLNQFGIDTIRCTNKEILDDLSSVIRKL